jgi:hypothetical protein
VIATAALVLVIFALARSGRLASALAAVGANVGAASWFTTSTSFANPAIDIGRMFSGSFAAATGDARSVRAGLTGTTRFTETGGHHAHGRHRRERCGHQRRAPRA